MIRLICMSNKAICWLHFFFLNYTEHLLGEAAFQIMEAKNILHNLDEVFPEIAAHLQTMMATRYFLQLERNNIDKYLHTGL